MFPKYMFDTRYLVLGLALGQLYRRCTAVEDGAICREFRNFGELLSISGLFFCS
jgi:hypothetical protein